MAVQQKPVLGWGMANVDYALEGVHWDYTPEIEAYFDQAHSTVAENLVAGGILAIGYWI